jgi:hypothetical protein
VTCVGVICEGGDVVGVRGHTCRWRLFEAATVGRYGAQQLEMGRPEDP